VLHCTGVYQIVSLTEQCHIESSLKDLINKHLRVPAEPLDTGVVVVEGDPSTVIAREAVESE